MTRDMISEYPYTGRISRVVEGSGMEEDTSEVVYEGVMDEHMVTADEGAVLQTSRYIVTIPLTKDDDGEYIIPDSGDLIEVSVYGKVLSLTVDNAEPSQLGGVSIYATRTSWNKKEKTVTEVPSEPTENTDEEQDEED